MRNQARKTNAREDDLLLCNFKHETFFILMKPISQFFLSVTFLITFLACSERTFTSSVRNMTEHFTSQSPTLTLNQSSDDGAFDYYGLSAVAVISLTVISICIAVIGTIANILVLVAVVENHQLRQTNTAILLANLSCFDVIICAVYVPLYTYDINCGSSFKAAAFRNKFGFDVFLGSLNSVFATSLDRSVSICFPYLYVEWMTGKITSIMIFLSWFVALALTAPSLPIDPPLYSFVYISVIIVLIVSFHIAMFLVARREARQIITLFPSERRRLPIWNKSTTVVATVMVTSVICWALIVILPITVSPSSPSFLRLIKTALAFTSLSSAVNLFIFCWRLTAFRHALSSRLCRANAVIHPN